MRLPNGYGTVYKLNGRRRKPWIVRLSDGWRYDEESGQYKKKHKILGYYESKKLGLQALAQYHENPYDIDAKKTTMEELFTKWFAKYNRHIEKSYERTIISAWAYCHPLYNMKVKDIRVYHLRECINDAYIIAREGKDKGKKRVASACVKARMKSVLNLMFDYACEYEVADKNYARLFNLDDEIVKEKARNKKAVVPFTDKEVELLWKNVDYPFVDMILIDIYSGWRPQELAVLQVENIDLDKNTMKGGLKTDAGKNRIVPIHPLIRNLIEQRLYEARLLGSRYLFNDINGRQGRYLTYDKYRNRFQKVMDWFDFIHRPHEARHTFITKAKSAGMDEYILKLIVGHAIYDVTEAVYTHRTVEDFHREMNKITK